MTAIYVSLTALVIAYHGYRWYTSKPHPEPAATSWTPDADAPRLSFLVPAWNAAKDIPGFVASYEALSYPRKELVLCAGGIDGSFEVAKRHASDGVKVLEQLPGEGKQMALQRSFPVSCGELIYLTDIDCRPSDDVVNNLLAQLANKNLAVVTGSGRPLDNQLADVFVQTQWAVEQVTHPKVIGETTGILGRNAALTRAAVEASGAFATPAPSGTDYTLAKEMLRAGLNIVYVPGSPMPTEYPGTFGIYTRKQARWIRNVFVLGRRYGSMSEVRATVVTLTLPYVILLLLALGLAGVGFAALVGLLLIFHAVLNRLWYLRLAHLTPKLTGSVRHFVADQAAAVRAGAQISRGVTQW